VIVMSRAATIRELERTVPFPASDFLAALAAAEAESVTTGSAAAAASATKKKVAAGSAAELHRCDSDRTLGPPGQFHLSCKVCCWLICSLALCLQQLAAAAAGGDLCEMHRAFSGQDLNLNLPLILGLLMTA